MRARRQCDRNSKIQTQSHPNGESNPSLRREFEHQINVDENGEKGHERHPRHLRGGRREWGGVESETHLKRARFGDHWLSGERERDGADEDSVESDGHERPEFCGEESVLEKHELRVESAEEES